MDTADDDYVIIGHDELLKPPRLVRDADGTMAALLEFAKKTGFDKLNDGSSATPYAADDGEEVADTVLETQEDTSQGDRCDMTTALVALWQKRVSELQTEEIVRHLVWHGAQGRTQYFGHA